MEAEYLLAAASVGNVDHMQQLIDRSPLVVNTTGEDGETAMHQAAAHGQLLALAFLLEAAPDQRNAAKANGDTVLHEAVRHGHLPIVKWLVEETDVDLHQRNRRGQTPLDMAAELSSPDILLYLRARALHRHSGTQPPQLPNPSSPTLEDWLVVDSPAAVAPPPPHRRRRHRNTHTPPAPPQRILTPSPIFAAAASPLSSPLDLPSDFSSPFASAYEPLLSRPSPSSTIERHRQAAALFGNSSPRVPLQPARPVHRQPPQPPSPPPPQPPPSILPPSAAFIDPFADLEVDWDGPPAGAASPVGRLTASGRRARSQPHRDPFDGLVPSFLASHPRLRTAVAAAAPQTAPAAPLQSSSSSSPAVPSAPPLLEPSNEDAPPAPAPMLSSSPQPSSPPFSPAPSAPTDTIFGRTTRLKHSDLRRMTGDFEPSRQLQRSSSAFGTAFLAEWNDGRPVLVKALGQTPVRARASAAYRRQLRRDLHVLAETATHRHLLPLLGACVDGVRRSALVYVLPSTTVSTLESILASDRHLASSHSAADSPTSAALCWRQRLRIAREIAQALTFLHTDLQPALLHLDLRAATVFLDASLGVRLGDYGAALLLADTLPNGGGGGTSSTTAALPWIPATPGYTDPDYVRNRRLCPSIDVFAYGVILGELLSGWAAFDPALDPPDLPSRVALLEADELAERTLGWPMRVAAVLTNIMHDCLGLLGPRRPITTSILARVSILAQAHLGADSDEDNVAGPAVVQTAPHSTASASGATGPAPVVTDTTASIPECVICFERATHALVPCGHVCVCAEHVKAVVSPPGALPRRCPICRSHVRESLKLFF